MVVPTLWGKGVVARLVAQLLLENAPVLHGEHEVMSSPTEMLTDRLPVIGDGCNLHCLLLSFWCHLRLRCGPKYI